jgi:DNA adenine methylase
MAEKQKVNSLLKPPISYYGGKQQLLSRILPLIPAHEKYIEPFTGGGAVFWSKEPSKVEVLNDLNGFISNFYEVCKTRFEDLDRLIKSKPYSRLTHDHALVIMTNAEMFGKVKRAWAFYYLANTSMFSILDAPQKTPDNKNKPINTYNNKNDRFTAVYEERLKNVHIESRDALYIISKNDAADNFMFIDPPYFNSECGHYAGYSKEDYRNLLDKLAITQSKFLLTSYPSDILNEYIEKYGWIVERHDMSLSVSNKSKRKTEVFVRNYKA